MPDGVARLGRAGVGVIIGGVVLGVCSFIVAPVVGALLVLIAGIAAGLYQRHTTDPFRIVIGVFSIGAIALIEALGHGLGLEPLELAFVAVLFGLFDIVASRLLRVLQDRY